jgi:hypothetical protein
VPVSKECTVGDLDPGDDPCADESEEPRAVCGVQHKVLLYKVHKLLLLLFVPLDLLPGFLLQLPLSKHDHPQEGHRLLVILSEHKIVRTKDKQ